MIKLLCATGLLVSLIPLAALQAQTVRPSVELRLAIFRSSMSQQLARIEARQNQIRSSKDEVSPLVALSRLPANLEPLPANLDRTHPAPGWMAPGWMAPVLPAPTITPVLRLSQPALWPGARPPAVVTPARRVVAEPVHPGPLATLDTVPLVRPAAFVQESRLVSPAASSISPPQQSASVMGAEVPPSEVDNSPLTDQPAALPVAVERRSALPLVSIRAENIIHSYAIELPYNKTISVIFPKPIKSVDLGSRQIIADKASDVENVLKVKAAQIGFNETNFSVITVDGKFYSFVTTYNEYPGVLALNLAASPTGYSSAGGHPSAGDYINGTDGSARMPGTIQFSGIRASQTEVVANCEKVLQQHRTIRHLGVSENLMSATVRGFYVKDNVMYVKVRLTNKSHINYDLDYMRFFIVDKTQAKKTTLQELELLPFYIYPEAQRQMLGKSSIDQVLAFPKFTIPDNKHIVVQINEAGGGRALTFLMNNEDIMHSGKL